MKRAKKVASSPAPSRAFERLARVEARLDSVEQTAQAGFSALSDQLKSVHACIDKVDQRIEASLHGSMAQPGLVVRLDRLEQAQERTRWLTRAIIGAVVTLAVGGLWSLLR